MKITILFVVVTLVVTAGAWFIAFLRHRARMQHYVFAHQLLPAQLFAEPEATLVPMVNATGFSEEGRQHLLQFWEAAGKDFSESDLVPGEALTYQMVVLGHPNSTAFLIELPKPEKKTEAHFILMVFDAPGLCCQQIEHLRYFVLEHYGQKDGVPRTELGEWVPKEGDGLKYVGHGAGTPPEQAAFMAKVEEIIKISGSQPKRAS